jgi:DNA polymerase I - 3''-5'' exonuclease and polymerase domains
MKYSDYSNTAHTLCLVESVDDLRQIETDGKTVALNVETTGFDYNTDSVVGVSIAVLDGDRIVSYYIPLRHSKGHNVDTEPVFDLVQKVIDGNKVLLYNREFVFTFLEKDGIRCGLNHTHDAQIMLYLCTNKPCPTRNEYAHLYFPDVPIYELDLERVNFAQHDPEISYLFAAQKTVLTIMLARKVWDAYPMIHNIYRLDNESNEVVRWICRNTELPVSKERVRNELNSVNTDIDEVKYKLRGLLGYDAEIDNPNKRLELVRECVGMVDSLSDFIVKDSTNPVVMLVKQYGELAVYRTTLEKMLNYGDTIRVRYSTVTAATGRLSSGGARGNTFFNDFNIQAVEKKDVVRYVHKADNALGFTVDDNPEDAVREVKCKGGLRDAFVCPDGYVWVSADYSGEEMVLAACFSKDENLIEPIREGKDIHRHIAETMFGQADDESRSKIKQLNFSVIYGATEYSISRRLKITVDECKAMLTKYFSHLSGLASWRQRMVEKARKNGYVSTLFGRPRMLFESYQKGDYRSADRCACNSPIQGCTPLSGHLETEHSAVRMENIIGRKVRDIHGGMIIPTHRGESEPLFCLFGGGEWMICDDNHSLVYGKRKSPRATKVRDGLRGRVWLAKLRKRRWKINHFVFKSVSDCASLFVLLCKRDGEIKDDNVTLNSALLKLALTRHWFKADYKAAVSLRSVASLFGYNVVYSERRDKFRVSFFRRGKTRLKKIWWCLEKGMTVPVGSCTKITDMQMYDNQGFVNKNTGADIIRIDLCKFKRLFDTDSTWAENVRFANTVHDECNFYVREEYLYNAVEKIYDTMYFEHPLMALPLKASVSVGQDWGHLVEVDIDKIKTRNKNVV